MGFAKFALGGHGSAPYSPRGPSVFFSPIVKVGMNRAVVGMRSLFDVWI